MSTEHSEVGSGREVSRRRSASGDRNRDRDRSRRSRSRGRGDRDRDRDRDRHRDKDRERDRDRDRDCRRSRSRERERERSLSPISRRAKVRKEAQQRALANSSDKVWDGFQWVRKATMNPAISEALSGVDLGHQKDRRIYVGNLPHGMSGEELKAFMNEALTSYTLAGVESNEPPPPAVTSIWMSGDGKYGFLEMFSANLAQIAMSLNGLQYNGATLRIARPKTYSEQYNGVSNIPGASAVM
jgi:splicing factor U2AF 65 kDa subunit